MQTIAVSNLEVAADEDTCLRIDTMPQKPDSTGLEDYLVIRIDLDNKDTYATNIHGGKRRAAYDYLVEIAAADGCVVQWQTVRARDAGAARITTPARAWLDAPPKK